MELIKKTLKHKGTETTVYFRELTAGEQLSLVKGQTYRGNAKSGNVEIDVGENVESQQRLVLMTLVDENGNQVYAHIKQLHAEPASKIIALGKLAEEAQRTDVDDAGDALPAGEAEGNG